MAGRVASIVVLLALLQSCSGGAGRQTPAAAGAGERGRSALEPSGAELTCNSSDDCVILPRPDCCGCTAGGMQGAISREHLPTAEARLERACAEIVCPMVMSTDPSCTNVVPSCVAGRCQLTPQQ